MVTGSVSMSEMITTIRGIPADSRFRPEFTVTLDIRKAAYTAELADGDLLSGVLREKRNEFQNRFAVVVPESLHFMARLYCALTKLGGFEKIQCFTDMDAAREWCVAAP